MRLSTFATALFAALAIAAPAPATVDESILDLLHDLPAGGPHSAQALCLHLPLQRWNHLRKSDWPKPLGQGHYQVLRTIKRSSPPLHRRDTMRGHTSTSRRLVFRYVDRWTFLSCATFFFFFFFFFFDWWIQSLIIFYLGVQIGTLRNPSGCRTQGWILETSRESLACIWSMEAWAYESGHKFLRLHSHHVTIDFLVLFCAAIL